MEPMVEGDLRIAVPKGAAWRKFDGAGHGLSHCMKAVDFVVQLPDRWLFIECKDPDDPTSDPAKRKEFVGKLRSGRIDGKLKLKYRDSFLYEWASGRADKPIYYLVLIAVAALSEAELLARTEALKRCLPLSGPNHAPWNRPFVAGCAVMHVAAWNRQWPKFAVSRVSA